MEYTFYRSGSGSYLVIRREKLSDGYIRRMLEKADIPQLLEECVVQVGDGCELHYRISGMQTLERRCAAQKMGTSEAEALLDAIVQLQSVCAAHLLPDTHLFLTPDLIYSPYLQTDFRFLYLPEEETTFAEQIRELADFMMKHISYEGAEDAGVELVYALQEASGQDGFELRDWWRAHRGDLHRGKMTSDSAIRADLIRESMAQEGSSYDVPRIQTGDRNVTRTDWGEAFSEASQAVLLSEERDLWRQENPYADLSAGRAFSRWRKKPRKDREERKERKKSMDRKAGRMRHRKKKEQHEKEKRQETILWRSLQEAGAAQELSSDGMMPQGAVLQEPSFEEGREIGTTLLSEPGAGTPRYMEQTGGHFLIPLNGGQQIALDRPFLLLGASARNADIVISDPTVSRIHAEIFCDEAGVRIEDCNSSNGTLVDGQMLGPNEQKKLETGMHILLGRAEFVFR